MALEVHIIKKLGNFTLKADFTSSGGCSGILVESGCGKSMFLKCISGIETPDSGSIVLDGNILFDSEKKINLPPQKRNVGYLFQNYALFPTMTVAENIAAGLKAKKKFLSAKDKESIQKTVQQQIERCRLQGLENHYPSQLSGGQQQRTALARMLAVNPSMIMLDEPFSALDSHLKDAMQQEMQEIISNFPGNILIVSHSRDELYRLCDTLSVMSAGIFIRNGNIKEVFQNPVKTQAAILTGCKNISTAVKCGENMLFLPEWGLTLTPAAPIPDSITHAGIRAHYFHFVRKMISPSDVESTVLSDSGTDNMSYKNINHFQAQIVSLDERPFEFDYYLKTDEGTKTFVWKVHKSADSAFKQGDWLEFFIAADDIMMLV